MIKYATKVLRNEEEYYAFRKGIDWADENPKDGLVNLDKVCKYLKTLTYQEYPSGPLERLIDDYTIEKLRKAMEE